MMRILRAEKGKTPCVILTDTRETKDTGGDHSDESEERDDEGKKERGDGDAKTGATRLIYAIFRYTCARRRKY